MKRWWRSFALLSGLVYLMTLGYMAYGAVRQTLDEL